ncbi:MAG TPA: hypothetical protein VG013_41265 [Gemmataceae bacterium]|jgi:hypothetical protein|nr:hypothetical protein [Gemmataceae bacterium]
MPLLEPPTAQALLANAVLSAASVRRCQEHLSHFLQRSLPLFYREEQRKLATVVIPGRLSGLERKTSEPLASLAGRPRKPVQHVVGAGLWDDAAVLEIPFGPWALALPVLLSALAVPLGRVDE